MNNTTTINREHEEDEHRQQVCVTSATRTSE